MIMLDICKNIIKNIFYSKINLLTLCHAAEVNNNNNITMLLLPHYIYKLVIFFLHNALYKFESPKA